MLANLQKRGEELARERAQEKLADMAAQLRGQQPEASVASNGAQIVISGRGIAKRWLTNPALRLLTWGLR